MYIESQDHPARRVGGHARHVPTAEHHGGLASLLRRLDPEALAPRAKVPDALGRHDVTRHRHRVPTEGLKPLGLEAKRAAERCGEGRGARRTAGCSRKAAAVLGLLRFSLTACNWEFS